MIVRYSGAIAFSALITLALFFMMQLLIASDEYEIEERIGINLTDVTMEEREQSIRRKDRDKPERQEVKPPPPPQMTNVNLNQNADMGGVRMQFDTSVNADVNFGGVSASLDRGSYPKFRVQHQYPRRAQERGIPGCVIYGFTITKTGSTKDVFVIESSNSMFDRYGLKSIEQYKYEPMVINGEAREDPGQTIRLIWEMEGEKLPDNPACR